MLCLPFGPLILQLTATCLLAWACRLGMATVHEQQARCFGHTVAGHTGSHVVAHCTFWVLSVVLCGKGGGSGCAACQCGAARPEMAWLG
jgi:hypothetical protein